MTNDTQLQSCDELLRRRGVELVLQHGSTVAGKEHNGSDLDVAVFRRGAPLSFEEWNEVRLVLENALGERTDIGVVDTGSDPLYAYEAFRHEKTLWQADADSFGWWASLVVRRYDDTHWLRAIEAKVVKKRFGRSHVS
jgi:predicted nucleotidyltransferase